MVSAFWAAPPCNRRRLGWGGCRQRSELEEGEPEQRERTVDVRDRQQRHDDS